MYRSVWDVIDGLTLRILILAGLSAVESRHDSLPRLHTYTPGGGNDARLTTQLIRQLGRSNDVFLTMEVTDIAPCPWAWPLRKALAARDVLASSIGIKVLSTYHTSAPARNESKSINTNSSTYPEVADLLPALVGTYGNLTGYNYRRDIQIMYTHLSEPDQLHCRGLQVPADAYLGKQGAWLTALLQLLSVATERFRSSDRRGWHDWHEDQLRILIADTQEDITYSEVDSFMTGFGVLTTQPGQVIVGARSDMSYIATYEYVEEGEELHTADFVTEDSMFDFFTGTGPPPEEESSSDITDVPF